MPAWDSAPPWRGPPPRSPPRTAGCRRPSPGPSGMAEGSRFSLAGRRALVTGASRGIGRALALGLAEAGADLALAGRTAEDLQATAEAVAATGRRALRLTLDVA